MTGATLIAFVLSFVAGPLLCAAAIRLPERTSSVAALALAMVAVTAFGLSRQGSNPPLSLTAMWLGWVLAVAMVALALRRRISQPGPRRLILIIALLATTLPWFGLATARLMAA